MDQELTIILQQDISKIDIINISLSTIMVVISILGVIGLYNIRTAQHKACYGFYLNILAHINVIKSYLSLGGKMPDWCKILGMDYSARLNDNNKDAMEKARRVAEHSKKFLVFLQSATNQVPPFVRKKKKRNWYDNMNKLCEHIIKFALWDELSNTYSEWSESNRDKTYGELQQVIKFIEDSITNKIKKA